jgi:DEAD/DEAH box helicase domain-containing protein
VAELLELTRAGESRGESAATFDGDTPGDAASGHPPATATSSSPIPTCCTRASCRITPSGRSCSRSLRYVVIDEIHSLSRRVRLASGQSPAAPQARSAPSTDRTPQFILCSATIGNPQGARRSADRGRRVTAITDSGAPTGDKHVLLWNPPVHQSRSRPARLGAFAEQRASRGMAIKAGLKTLVFAQSRTMVEVLTKYLKDVFDHDPRKPPRIRAYRGGYLPTERRAAERDDARRQRIDGIVTTSALELGVDIGSLDVVVLNGYPGIHRRHVAALRPRRSPPAAGARRAGGEQFRSAGSIPRAPSGVLRRARRRSTPASRRTRPVILLDHIRCAAFELPFVAMATRFGPVDPRAYLDRAGRIRRAARRRRGRHEWIADSYPANAVSACVRSPTAISSWSTAPTAASTIIAEVDYSAAAAHPVRRRDPHGPVHRRTRSSGSTGTGARPTSPAPTSTTTPTPSTTPGSRCWRSFDGARRRCRRQAQHGEVHVLRRVAGYKKIRYYTHENIGYGPVNLPDAGTAHHGAVVAAAAARNSRPSVRLAPGRARRLSRRRACAASGRDASPSWPTHADLQKVRRQRRRRRDRARRRAAGAASWRRHEGPPTALDDLARLHAHGSTSTTTSPAASA